MLVLIGEPSACPIRLLFFLQCPHNKHRTHWTKTLRIYIYDKLPCITSPWWSVMYYYYFSVAICHDPTLQSTNRREIYKLEKNCWPDLYYYHHLDRWFSLVWPDLYFPLGRYFHWCDLTYFFLPVGWWTVNELFVAHNQEKQKCLICKIASTVHVHTNRSGGLFSTALVFHWPGQVYDLTYIFHSVQLQM